MGDISTIKHYSDDAVRGWREGRRGMKEGIDCHVHKPQRNGFVN